MPIFSFLASDNRNFYHINQLTPKILQCDDVLGGTDVDVGTSTLNADLNTGWAVSDDRTRLYVVGGTLANNIGVRYYSLVTNNIPGVPERVVTEKISQEALKSLLGITAIETSIQGIPVVPTLPTDSGEYLLNIGDDNTWAKKMMSPEHIRAGWFAGGDPRIGSPYSVPSATVIKDDVVQDSTLAISGYSVSSSGVVTIQRVSRFPSVGGHWFLDWQDSSIDFSAIKFKGKVYY